MMDAYLVRAYILVQQAITRLRNLAHGAQSGQSVVEFMVLAAGMAVVALILVQIMGSIAHQSGNTIQNCFNGALTPVPDVTATPAASCH